MTFEIDPDIWLAARVTFGRRWWGLIFPVGICAGVIAASGPNGSLRHVFTLVASAMPRNPWPAHGDPALLAVALVMFVSAPLEVTRMLELERRGVLDHTRLCGRPPSRVLAALLATYVFVPFVTGAALLIVNRIQFGGEFGVVWIAALLMTIVLDMALVGFSVLGQSAVLPLLIACYAVLGTAIYLGWFADAAVHRAQAIAALVALGALPVAVRLACRRLERPVQRLGLPTWSSPASMIARALPHAGPPEFVRQLRRSTIQQARFFEVIAGLFLAAFATATYGHASGWSRSAMVGPVVLMNALPFLIVLFAAVAIATTTRSEFQSGSFDLVRLTAQEPESIAAGWYAGISLPFWIVALAIPLMLRFAAPDMFATSTRAGPALWWRSPLLWLLLGTPAMLLPAWALVEPFQRRPPTTYFVYGIAAWYALIVMAGGPPASSEFRAAHPIASEVSDLTGRVPTLGGEALSLTSVLVMFPLATTIALGAVAGRIRRPDGPALAGPAAAAAVFAVAWSLRVVNVNVLPSVIVAVVPLVASFVGEERPVPSRPWIRVGLAMAAAFVSVAGVKASLGIDTALAVTTAAASALALGTAVLGHELLHRWTVAALGLPIVMMLAVLRFPRPPVLLLAGAFVALAIVHARRCRSG